MDNTKLLADLVAEYEPYGLIPAFGQGFIAHARRDYCNPYDGDDTASGQVSAQAWDRGLECAARYARAMAAAERGAVVEQMRRPAPKPSLLAKLMSNGGSEQ